VSTLWKPEHEEHWEDQKANIEKLYLELNLPVDDVAAIMKANFQFSARWALQRGSSV